jgi:Domain of unknown function (DUF4184)
MCDPCPPVPFTFFAHQAPVLPIKRRQPDRWDGLALVVGSMAPDLAYVSAGTDHYFSGHRLQNQLVLMVGSVLLTYLVGWFVLPVAPLALPDGASPLRDALLDASRTRRRVWVVAYSALIGQLTHLALDAFTHRDGYVVQNVAFFRSPWFEIGGHNVTLYNVLQYGLSIVLGFWCVFMLERWWSEPRPGSEAPRATLLPVGVGLVVACSIVGMVAASVVAPSRYGVHQYHGQPYVGTGSTSVITWCWIAFAGLLVGCLVARPFVRTSDHDHQPRSIHS